MIDATLLYGAWHLEAFQQLDANGLTLRSRSDSKGLLIYLGTGEMSVSMSREVETEDQDIKRNFVRHLYYAGKFRVEDDMIIHHVEIALHDPHRNQQLPRRARLEDENRKLILEALSPEQRVIGTIFWRRK